MILEDQLKLFRIFIVGYQKKNVLVIKVWLVVDSQLAVIGEFVFALENLQELYKGWKDGSSFTIRHTWTLTSALNYFIRYNRTKGKTVKI